MKPDFLKNLKESLEKGELSKEAQILLEIENLSKNKKADDYDKRIETLKPSWTEEDKIKFTESIKEQNKIISKQLEEQHKREIVDNEIAILLNTVDDLEKFLNDIKDKIEKLENNPKYTEYQEYINKYVVNIKINLDNIIESFCFDFENEIEDKEES